MCNWSNSASIAAHDAGRHKTAEEAEIIVRDALGAKRVSNVNVGCLWDLEFCGIKIDVKTKRRNVAPQADHDAHVEASQIEYPVDAYVFCSSNIKSGRTEMVGWLWKSEFDCLCRKVKKGDPDGPFRERADAYKIKHYRLRPIKGMRKSMSEFWMCRDANQLKERLGFFEKWLLEEWDWSRPVEWKVKPYVGRRSLSQNALFHVWCREMADHFSGRGVDIDQEKAKDLLKYRFLGTHDIIVSTTTIPNQLKSTSKLDRGEMFDFMNQVQVWLLDHGVNLSCPDDSEYMQILGGKDDATAIRRN